MILTYVLVITPPGGIWLIYKHNPQGWKTPEGGVLVSQPYPNWRCYNLFDLLLGLALGSLAISSVSQLVDC